MSDNNSVLLEMAENGVATITLNRPESHNAFDEHMIKAIFTAIKEIEQAPNIKILVLKSIGKSFSAGADLLWMKKMAHYSPSENLQDARKLGQLMHRLYHFKKPTLAIVQGNVFGGGIGLVAACQIAIAANHVSFCFSETKLGLIPSVISPYIVNAIGHRQARAYFLSAIPIDAMNALRMGLCHEVVKSEALDERAKYWINALLQNGPQALQEVNLLLSKFVPITITSDLVEFTAERIATLRASKEGQEGIAAFLEKRKPTWVK